MRDIIKFKNFEITKREIIASISIISIMMFIGVLISSSISEYRLDKNEIYNKSIKIESFDLFSYGMRTNVGNAFVFGELSTIDPVTYQEIGGEYMYVEKVKEEYTRHTRRVARTRTINGKTETYYETEVYYTWDIVSSEDIKCTEVSFCGVTFNVNKINIPNSKYITTVKVNSDTRYKYYGTDIKFIGTIFTELKSGTISDNSTFFNGKTINETLEYLSSNNSVILFWIIWIFIILGCIYSFFYLENKWLD